MSKDWPMGALLGYHVLTGCDYLANIGPRGYDEQIASGIAFVLDGVTLMVSEDPQDGYRSSMDALEVSDYVVANTFPACHVTGRWRKEEYGRKSESIEFVDVYTKQVVLAVGTENSDDWYPSFVACFTPEAMFYNQERVEQLENDHGMDSRHKQ